MSDFKPPQVNEVYGHIQNIKEQLQQNSEVTQQALVRLSATQSFTAQDNREFRELLQEINHDALRRITSFYQVKLHEKIKEYQVDITKYGDNNEAIDEQIRAICEILNQSSSIMAERLRKKDAGIVRLLIKTEQQQVQRKVFNIMRNHQKRKQRKRRQMQEVELKYDQYLMKKCFQPWRGITLKQGYQNALVRSAQQDLKGVQAHYNEAIKLLKSKIAEADELIAIKRNAKAEFSYSLSRNLLKTISNLSMEVISLNQVVIKDNASNKEEVGKYLRDINNEVKKKMEEVQNVRDRLVPGVAAGKRPVLFDV